MIDKMSGFGWANNPVVNHVEKNFVPLRVASWMRKFFD